MHTWTMATTVLGTNWWTDDLPPIGGGLRALFYAGLLVLCLIDRPSPLHAPEIMGRVEPTFYTPVGALRMLGLHWVPPAVLRVVKALTILAWIGATIGAFQPYTALATFLGFAFLHAVNAGALGSNHSTHAALYVLFCLGFCVTHDRWTLDFHLFPDARGGLAHNFLSTGFAPKLALVFLCYCMFAGGVAKLRWGGLRWLNGDMLRFYVSESAEFARWPAFARLLTARPRLCCALACFTVGVELASLLALCSPELRLAFVAAWIGLHVGILLVMMPAYWIQMWCYLLVMDCVLAAGRAGPDGVTPPTGQGTTQGQLLASGIGIAVCVLLALGLWRSWEAWPFTSVPMYSNGIRPDQESLPSERELQAAALRAQAGDPAAWKRPWVTAEAWEDIKLVPRAGGDPVPLLTVLDQQPAAKAIRWSQYAKVLRQVAIADLAAKPEGKLRVEDAGANYPAMAFLQRVAGTVRRNIARWQDYGRLEFVCRASGGDVVIGRVDLP